jgi:hypothetical protein
MTLMFMLTITTIMGIAYFVAIFACFIAIMSLLEAKGAKERILWAFALLVIIGFMLILSWQLHEVFI